jgi:hypothetical protein
MGADGHTKNWTSMRDETRRSKSWFLLFFEILIQCQILCNFCNFKYIDYYIGFEVLTAEVMTISIF